MHPFVTATTWARQKDGLYSGVVDESWNLHRGVFGGVVAGGLLRAFTDAVGDASRPVRAITTHFSAPLAPERPFSLRTRIERSGSQITHVTGRIEQDGTVAAFGSATFGLSRTDPMTYDESRAPEAPPADSVDPVPSDLPLLPTFARHHVEYRFCLGHPPYSGADRAETGGWVRLREPLTLDAPAVVALLDAMPPAAIARADGFRSAASVSFTVRFFAPLPDPAPPDAPWLARLTSRWAGEGFADETARLWSADGRLIAQCDQLMSIL